MQYSSIKFRLSLAFCLFLFLVIFIGAFGIACLNDFNGVAAQIRDRWLPNTRLLGDLNNYTSDFRAAEGTILLSTAPRDIAATERDMQELDQNITKAQRGYEQIFHDEKESGLYRIFSGDWDKYRSIVNKIVFMMHHNDAKDAIDLYKTSSAEAYNAASDTLGLLTDLNVTEDRDATDRSNATYKKALILIGMAILLGVLILVAGVTYIRRHISTPLLNLAAKMHLIANNNMDIDARVSGRCDEIGEMEHAVLVFRNNTIELMQSRLGLEQQASMLEEKLEKERSLMEMQRNFISMASHEFRTPLNIIDGHAQRLMKIKASTPMEEITARAVKLRESVQQMTALIDNLLNSSRLFENNPELYFHPTDMDLAVLLREICDQHRDISGMEITLKPFSQRLHMLGDPKLLQQMFSNLLSNAVKYSPDGGIIEVSAVMDSGKIMASVTDRGMGIPQKDIEGVFERYSRGSNVSDISGTGIGLYLARMVAKLHGGEIRVESREGEGSKFTVQLSV